MVKKFLRILLVLLLVFNFEASSFGKVLTDEDLMLETQKLYCQAKDYYLRGKLAEAQKEVSKILKIDPEDEAAQEFSKVISSELKRKTQKEILFLKHYTLGKKSYRMQEWDEAKRELRSAVEAYPQHKNARQAIKLWDRVNQEIIQEAKKKAEAEVRLKAQAIREQEEKIADLKIKKELAKKKRKKIKKEISKPQKAVKEAEKEKPVVNLQSCIQIALCNNLPVKIAKEQVDLAEMQLFEAWRVLFPSVTGELSDTYGKTTEEAYETKAKSLQFQQLVFDGGRSVFRLHQAKLGQKISQENFNAVKQKLIYEVEGSYCKLIHLQKVVKEYKSLYEEAKGFLELTKKQYQLGYVSRLEFLNLESEFNQLGYGLISSQQALSLAKLKFQQILNLDVPFALEIDSELGYNPDLAINLDRCLDLALRNRPEIRSSQLSLASSKYGEKIAKRKAWPELSLTGSIGESGEAYTKDVLHMKDEWLVLGKLRWSFGGNSLDYSYSREKVNPTEIAETGLTTEARTHNLKFGLLDNLDYFSKSKEAEIDFHKTMDNYQELRQKIILEVKEGYYLYERAKIMLQAVKSKIKYFQKEMEIAELRKSLDIIPLSAVLRAKVNLSEQQIAYSKALMEYYLALSTLNRAVGISFYYSYGRSQS